MTYQNNQEENNKEDFGKQIESLGTQNGDARWWADELSEYLGYATFASFKNVIHRAMHDAISIGVEVTHEFQSAQHGNIESYRLTRFAVMLCVSQSDNKKEVVRRVQLYLTSIAEALFREVERVHEREKLKGNEKIMVSTAVKHGLGTDKIGLFKDSGYRGLYNMSLTQLKIHKGVGNIKGTLYDRMGHVELAANSFRAALTSEKIRNEKITDENRIISAANSIGKQVRDVVIENTGQKPEDIQLENKKINEAKKQIKKRREEINKIPLEK